METTADQFKQRAKKREQISRSRNQKSQFQIFVNGFFNMKSVPWGYNYVLGYCEQSNNFGTN